MRKTMFVSLSVLLLLAFVPGDLSAKTWEVKLVDYDEQGGLYCAGICIEKDKDNKCIKYVVSDDYGCEIGTYNGVTAYSNGDWTGTGIGYYYYQCVDLAKRHFSNNYGIEIGVVKKAMNIFTKRYYDEKTGWHDVTFTGGEVYHYENGDKHSPEDGDLLVYHGTTWGHVRILKDVEVVWKANGTGTGTAGVFEQNMKPADTPFGTTSFTVDENGGYQFEDEDNLIVSGWVSVRSKEEKRQNQPIPTTRPLIARCVDSDGRSKAYNSGFAKNALFVVGDSGWHPLIRGEAWRACLARLGWPKDKSSTPLTRAQMDGVDGRMSYGLDVGDFIVSRVVAKYPSGYSRAGESWKGSAVFAFNTGKWHPLEDGTVMKDLGFTANDLIYPDKSVLDYYLVGSMYKIGRVYAFSASSVAALPDNIDGKGGGVIVATAVDNGPSSESSSGSSSGSSSSGSTPSPEPTPEPTPEPESGIWQVQNNENKSGVSIGSSNSVAQPDITVVNTITRDRWVAQPWRLVSIVAGARYRISLTIDADVTGSNRTAVVQVLKHTKPYNSYGCWHEIQLRQGKMTYIFSFQATHTDAEARFGIHLGDVVGTITVSSVVFQQEGAVVVVTPQPEPSDGGTSSDQAGEQEVAETTTSTDKAEPVQINSPWGPPYYPAQYVDPPLVDNPPPIKSHPVTETRGPWTIGNYYESLGKIWFESLSAVSITRPQVTVTNKMFEANDYLLALKRTVSLKKGEEYVIVVVLEVTLSSRRDSHAIVFVVNYQDKPYSDYQVYSPILLKDGRGVYSHAFKAKRSDKQAVLALNFARMEGRIRVLEVNFVHQPGDLARRQELFALAKAVDFSGARVYPNPFNSQVTISFPNLKDQDLSIRIFNLLGQEAAVLTDGYFGQGEVIAIWDGRDNNGRELSSGVYIVVLYTKEGKDIIERVVLVR
ncbi:T9SS type A sorting domain-containing protein [Candidatus Falkowbacteria bacterium]|nr:T9SS type A sorting domain-containing protein [Candidatus Falkowbacteria bacterium]